MIKCYAESKVLAKVILVKSVSFLEIRNDIKSNNSRFCMFCREKSLTPFLI